MHRYVLLVMREGVFATHALPAHGVVSIGRSSECTVCVDDTAISRRHALLHIGPVIELEDLQRVRQHRNLPSLRGIAVALIVGFIWREDLNSYLWTVICQQCGSYEMEIFNVEAQAFVKAHNKACGAVIGEGGK